MTVVRRLVARSNTAEPTLMSNSGLCAQFAGPVRYTTREFILYSDRQMCCENRQQNTGLINQRCVSMLSHASSPNTRHHLAESRQEFMTKNILLNLHGMLRGSLYRFCFAH